LEENVAAASISLDAAQMRALDDALAPEKISGPRYSPAHDVHDRPIANGAGMRRLPARLDDRREAASDSGML
jgi:hypothetical protein